VCYTSDVLTRAHAQDLDAQDVLADLRTEFELPEGQVYLVGNSLGLVTKRAAAQAHEAIAQWERSQVGGWNEHGWMDLPLVTGDRIGALLGAAQGQVTVVDSTTVNIFRLLCAALALRPGRRTIVVEADNFPADNYIAQGVRDLLGSGIELRAVPGAELASVVDEDVAVVLASHVNYASGRVLGLEALTSHVHKRGALVLWDMCHSAGVMEVELDAWGVDLAVGCTYKYLNGGPGSPGYLYVAERLQSAIVSPFYGWLGHAEPFAFETQYRAAPGMRRHLCGTPGVIGMACMAGALAVTEAAPRAALRAKSMALTGLFVDLVEQECAGMGFGLVSPTRAVERGSHVALSHSHAHAIVQALRAAGVVGDFRAPDLLRFGFAPLYTRYVDVWEAVQALRGVMREDAWDQPAYTKRARVT